MSFPTFPINAVVPPSFCIIASILQGAPPGFASISGFPCSLLPFSVKSINNSPSAVTSYFLSVIAFSSSSIFYFTNILNFYYTTASLIFAFYFDSYRQKLCFLIGSMLLRSSLKKACPTSEVNQPLKKRRKNLKDFPAAVSGSLRQHSIVSVNVRIKRLFIS